MSTIFSMSYVIKSIWLRVNRNLNAILITHICVSYVLPQLKLVRFSLLLSFSSSSLTVRTVLRELIIEFWRLSSPESCASVGISAPLAYITICMQSGFAFNLFPCTDCGTETFPTSCWSPCGSIAAWGFLCTTFSCFHRRIFMPEPQRHWVIYGRTFIPWLKLWAFCFKRL